MHYQPIESSGEDEYLAHLGGGAALEPQPRLQQLDDVFGSAPTSPNEPAAQGGAHPSDVRRLESEHVNAGYREGITVAKESSIQAGFDEGFSLGATVGLRAGQLLGLVEGIADAVKGRLDSATETTDKLLKEAREELSTSRVFSAEYWSPDGNWKYEVTAKDGDEILFSDVAAGHPLIQKWTKVVDEQVNLWQLQLSILDDYHGPRLDSGPAEPLTTSAPTRAKQSLDW
jgi:hypothetical protein